MPSHTILPDWVVMVAPFLSGAVGVSLTAGVAWGIIKQKYIDLERRMGLAERKLEQTVPDLRCDRMREECRSAMEESAENIRLVAEREREWQRAQFQEIARFMGRFDSKKP